MSENTAVGPSVHVSALGSIEEDTVTCSDERSCAARARNSVCKSNPKLQSNRYRRACSSAGRAPALQAGNQICQNLPEPTQTAKKQQVVTKPSKPFFSFSFALLSQYCLDLPRLVLRIITVRISGCTPVLKSQMPDIIVRIPGRGGDNWRTQAFTLVDPDEAVCRGCSWRNRDLLPTTEVRLCRSRKVAKQKCALLVQASAVMPSDSKFSSLGGPQAGLTQFWPAQPPTVTPVAMRFIPLPSAFMVKMS